MKNNSTPSKEWEEKIFYILKSFEQAIRFCLSMKRTAQSEEEILTHKKHANDSLSHLFSQEIAKARHQERQEVLGVIESKKVSEMSASEYNEVVLTKDTPQHKNLRHRLTGSHNPSWITAEIYNLALDDIKAELEKAQKG